MLLLISVSRSNSSNNRRSLWCAICWLVLMLAITTGCQSQAPSRIITQQEQLWDKSDLTNPNSTIQAENQSQQYQTEDIEMTQIETFDQLPDNYDPRITTILSDPMPEGVLLSFYYIVASKNPRPNYRWELHRNGQLFLVRHSGQNPSFEVPFDRPLPSQPSQQLSDTDIQNLYAQLEQASFFDQPKLQKRTNVEGGSYVIVRARCDDTFHEVVYENIEDPLVEYLYSIAN